MYIMWNIVHIYSQDFFPLKHCLLYSGSRCSGNKIKLRGREKKKKKSRGFFSFHVSVTILKKNFYLDANVMQDKVHLIFSGGC